MIDESQFINKLKSYDNSNLEFDSLDQINKTIEGTMLPFRKRGINANEFTIINVGGFEFLNQDTVLNLFNILPPGPKLMERHRTHLVVGRYSQAVMIIFLLDIGGQKYILVQTRNPLNLNGAQSTELYRDYLEINDGKFDIEAFLDLNFKTVLSDATKVELTDLGRFWEMSGIVGSNIAVYVYEITLGDEFKSTEQLASALSTDPLTNPDNIIGNRKLELITLDSAKSVYTSNIGKSAEITDDYYLNDLLSITGLSCLFNYLQEKQGKSVSSIVE